MTTGFKHNHISGNAWKPQTFAKPVPITFCTSLKQLNNLNHFSLIVLQQIMHLHDAEVSGFDGCFVRAFSKSCFLIDASQNDDFWTRSSGSCLLKQSLQQKMFPTVLKVLDKTKAYKNGVFVIFAKGKLCRILKQRSELHISKLEISSSFQTRTLEFPFSFSILRI